MYCGYSDRELRAIARKVLNTMRATHDRHAALDAGRRMVRRELPPGYDDWDVVIAALGKLIARDAARAMDALYDNLAARYGDREGLPERESKLLDQTRSQLTDSIYEP